MYKRIVVEPCFADAHFLRAHIQNVCEYIKPDLFVIAEGMFPSGPENNTTGLENFKQKYTLNGDGKRSFDFKEMADIVTECIQQYPDIQIHWIPMDYGDKNTEECYIDAYHSFLQVIDPIDISPETLIFPLETDLFFTGAQATAVLTDTKALKPGEGFGSVFREFYESPRVYFNNNERIRKLAFKYGDGTLYRNVIAGNFEDKHSPKSSGFSSDCYIPIRPFQLFHYQWVRPETYFDFRISAQLNRSPEVIKQYIRAREVIRTRKSALTQQDLDLVSDRGFILTLNELALMDHPKHMRRHPNFEYYYGEDK
ncbi:hypothetical protein KA005_06550 [bacterium]|nr:hypothetical protein [bacterium]